MPTHLRTMLMAALALVSLVASRAFAQEVYNIDIYGPGQGKMYMAMAAPLGGGGAPPPGHAAELDQLIQKNLGFLPFLGLIPSSEILGGTVLTAFTGPDIDFRRFQLSGADFLMTTGWVGQDTVELRCYESFTQNMLLGKSYTIANPSQLPEVADKFCAALMEKLTGNGSFFKSKMAYVQKTGPDKAIFVIRPTGRDRRQVTNLTGYCMSPSWSANGAFLAFTYIDDRYHRLGIWSSSSGEVTTHKILGNSVIGPAFASGNNIAVSLSPDGDTDIYMLNSSFTTQTPIVKSPGIDVSPSFALNGSLMAFASDRFGTPAIFVRDGGGERRVSFQGSYDTDPSISPDGKFVAFTRRTSSGFRIFIVDLETGQERQVTFGPGNDEDPAFGPDGYFIAFTSTRAGGSQIYLTTRHGDEAILVPAGSGVSSPAWGLDPSM